jgi:hypothetical protein
MKNLLLISAFSLILYTNNAQAHHAFAADYDSGKEGLIAGTITEVIYKNPHARYYLDVINDNGGTETWDLQTMNLMMLGRVGWKKDTFKIGDKVQVFGILGRNNSKRMSITTITNEDGKVISPMRSRGSSDASKNVVTENALKQEFISTDIAIDIENAKLLGDWDIMTTGFAGGKTTSHVNVSFEEEAGKIKAYVYDGPVNARFNGNYFEFDLDWSTAWDTGHISTFSGKITDEGKLEGKVSHNGSHDFLGKPMQGGEFIGSRSISEQIFDDILPSLVDLSGIWNRASGFWPIRKINYAMTATGQSIIDNYLEMDNPNSRCGSMGLIMASGMPYTMEVINTEDYTVIVYGADYVRRIYLDDRKFPDTVANSSLGFSKGHWVGETLVVKTTNLTPAFMSTRGQPISANAYTIEHFYLDKDGYLHADLWLHDPENYTRAPYIRRVMKRNTGTPVVVKVGCDPYTFFRGLYLEGQLEEFWDRSAYRQ